MDYRVRSSGKSHKIVISGGTGLQESSVVEFDKVNIPITINKLSSSGELDLVTVNNKLYTVRVKRLANGFPCEVTIDGCSIPVEMERVESTRYKPVVPPKKIDGAITSILPGLVVDILVTPGQQVTKGTTLLVLEAMKMENEITAPGDSVVETIHATKGSVVSKGDLLVTLKVN